MRREINIEEVREFIKKQGPNTKIYMGADSERLLVDGKAYADYTLAIVVHIDGRHGAKIFGEIHRELDYDRSRDKPRMRLMTEVYKIADLYLKLADILEDRPVEIHLDINPDVKYGSNCIIHEAVGYIKGVCNVTPIVKPNAFAASYCADRLKFVLDFQNSLQKQAA